MSFNIEDHLEYRNRRYLNVNIDNPRLLGLGIVEINPTELCNRTCSFCPRHDPEIYSNRNLHMDLSTVGILIHQLEAAGFDGDIHITGFGEPTLHPNILDMIEICSDKFCTEMITNGDRLLAKKLNHRDLKTVGLNTLIVDCYDGEEHVSQMKEILSDCQIYYRIRDHYDNGEPELLKLYNFNNRGGLLNHSESLLRPCWLPFYKAFVDWDGEVRLCCNDWARSQPGFGNVHRERFDEIWMSENFVEIRKQLNTGYRQDLLACKNCDTCGTQNGFESVRIWQETF